MTKDELDSITISIAILQPNSDENPTEWQIAFNIQTNHGHVLYAPTTVYAYQLKGTTLPEVIEAAAKEVIPHQIAMLYGKYETPDYFDTLVPTITAKSEKAK